MRTDRLLGRRRLLRFLGASGLGLALGCGISGLFGEGAADGRTQLKYTANSLMARWLRPASTVAVGLCPTYDAGVYDCLRQAWLAAGMPAVAGKRVLVKPNLIDAIEGHPTTTAPAVVLAVADLLREFGASEVWVGDGSGFRRDGEAVARACGLGAGLRQRALPFIDLNYEDPRPVAAPADWFPGIERLWLPRAVREADLIVSVPKLKTHHWAGASLSMKNLFGLLPGCRYGWPKNTLHFNNIDRSILGMYEIARGQAPVVAVIDGIVGMEGDGPLFGQAVPHGFLAVSRDAVAADALAISLMGLMPSQVRHIEQAGRFGLGQTVRRRVTGADEASLRRAYTPPPTL